MTLVACISYLYLTVWTSLHLPFYHSALNTLSTVVYALLAFLCVGATLATGLGNDHTFSNIWLALFVFPVALGWLGPFWQARRIQKYVSNWLLLPTYGQLTVGARDTQTVGCVPPPNARRACAPSQPDSAVARRNTCSRQEAPAASEHRKIGRACTRHPIPHDRAAAGPR